MKGKEAPMERGGVGGTQTPAGTGPGPTGKDEYRPFSGTIYGTELDKPVPDFKNDVGTNRG